MIGALELGLIYAVMAVGVYLTFRVLDFPDLTVDGSFTSGAATAGVPGVACRFLYWFHCRMHYRCAAH